MNKYYLACYHLKSMIRSGSRLFYIILLGISVSVFGILFYSGYFLYPYYQAAEGSKVTIDLKPSAAKREVWEIVSGLELTDCPVDYVFLLPENPNLAEMAGGYSSRWNRRLMLGKNYGLNERRPLAVVAEYEVDFVEDGESPVGKVVNCQGEAFLAVGMVTFTEYDCYMVPVKYYALHGQTASIQYAYQKRLSYAQRNSIQRLLKASDRIEDFQIENNRSPFFSSDFMLSFMQILLIFAAIVINVFVMVYFWIIHFKKNYRIYAVCGAGKKEIHKIAMFQTMVLLSFGVVAGNIIFIIIRYFVRGYELVYQDGYGAYVGVSLFVLLFLAIFSFFVTREAVATDMIYNSFD